MHMLNMHASHLDKTFAMTQQRTHSADVLFWPKRRFQQPNRMQILEPLTIQHIGLAARDVTHMLGIDQTNLKPTGLQNLKQGYPIDACRFHRHGIDTALLEPVDEAMKVFRK